ncbi:MAG TPA: 2Fe-2S iron-sulfur cluster-binding protein [Ktedonobacterales bacterium]
MASVSSLERRPSPGQQPVTMQVVARVPAARDVMTLLLALPGTQRAPAAYRPGQFITLAFPTERKTLYRSYSLCGDGRADAPWEITVKRHEAGLISRYLYDRVHPGAILQASVPQGKFTLPVAPRPDTPLVFVAGGSGITPIYGMLRALARLAPHQRPRVWLHYAYHSPADAIYGRELAALDPRRQWLTIASYVTTAGGRLRAEHALASLGAAAQRAEWYLCGPQSFKRDMAVAARAHGVPAPRMHEETFASPAAHPVDPTRAGATAARVRLADSGAVLQAQAGETLLETLERNGYRPDFNCRAGACGTCQLRLLAGQVRDGGNGLTPAERAASNVLSCVAQPVGDVTLATAGQPVGASGVVWRGHAPAKRSLRIGLAAAAAALFFAVWGLTNHTPATQASNSNSSSSSASGSDSSSSSGGTSGQSTNSGSFSSQSGQSATNSSTGVS